MMNVVGADWIPQKNGNIIFPRAVLLIVLAGLLILSLVRPFMLMTEAVSHADGVLWRLWGYAILFIIAVVAAWIDSPPARMAMMPPLIWTLIIWSALSVTWSINPVESSRRLILTVISIWLTFITVDRLGAKKAFVVAQTILLAILIANYLSIILYPSFSIDNYNVTWNHFWHGIMSHKNIAGMSTGLTVIFFSLHGRPSTRLPRLAIAIGALPFLLLTQSRTSLIATAVALLTGLIVLNSFTIISRMVIRLLNYKKYLFSTIVLVVFVSVCLVLDGEWLLSLTRDPDLFTGRTQIWQPMLSSLFEHPFAGVGYGAYWSGATDSSTGPLAGVTQAHNGYLDLVVQVGMAGLLLALSAFVFGPIVSIARLMKSGTVNRQTCALSSAVLIFFVVSNFTETSLFDGDQIPQVFMTLVIAALVSTLRRQRGQLVSRDRRPAETKKNEQDHSNLRQATKYRRRTVKH
jgi:exopolysaccharide production protein ExoQ